MSLHPDDKNVLILLTWSLALVLGLAAGAVALYKWVSG